MRFESLGFEDVLVEDGNVRVSLEWVGEGQEGDFQEDDPNDVRLFRFTVFRHYEPNEEMASFFLDDESPLGTYPNDSGWRPVSGGSCCTQIPCQIPLEKAEKAAKHILEQVKSWVADQYRCKTVFEELSWMDEKSIDAL